MPHHQEGSSVVEWLVVIAVSAILFAVGLPQLTRFTHTSKTSGYSNDLLNDIWYARSEAIKQNTYVILCASADGISCVTSGSWNQGWLVYADHNGNNLRDASETVLRSHSAIDAGWAVSGNTPVRRHVRYGPNGETSAPNGAFQAGTISICKIGSEESERIQIVINKVGRPRTTKLSNTICEA